MSKHPLSEAEVDALVDEIQERLGDSTARKYGRRGVLAALGLATLGTGSASAQASGTVGTSSSPVDVFGYDVDASNSFTDPAGVQHTGELADLSDVGGAAGQWQEVNSGSNIEPIDGETVGTGTEDVDVGSVSADQLATAAKAAEVSVYLDGSTPVVSDRSGTTEYADANTAVQNGLSTLSAGETIYFADPLTVTEQTKPPARSTCIWGAEMTMDQQGDNTITSLLGVIEEDITLINPLLDYDRPSNTDDGNLGDQGCLQVNSSGSCTVVGGRLRRSIGPTIHGDAERLTIIGTRFESIGEHGIYANGMDKLAVFNATFDGLGKNVRGNVLKIRDTDTAVARNVNATYNSSQSAAVAGILLSGSTRHVDLEVHIDGGGFVDYWGQNTTNNDADFLRVSGSASNLAGNVWLANQTDDEMLRIEDATFPDELLFAAGDMTLQNVRLARVGDNGANTIKMDDCRIIAQSGDSYAVEADTADADFTIRDSYIRNDTSGTAANRAVKTNNGTVTLIDSIVNGPEGGASVEFNSGGNVIRGGRIGGDVAAGSPAYSLRDRSSDNRIDDVEIVSGPAFVEGDRLLIDGVGQNSGDPSSTGVWSGNGIEGAEVVDTANANLYVYRGGAWV